MAININTRIMLREGVQSILLVAYNRQLIGLAGGKNDV